VAQKQTLPNFFKPFGGKSPDVGNSSLACLDNKPIMCVER